MKSLIVGMGIGNLYKSVLTNLGHEIVTVDINPSANADYSTIGDACLKHKHFDTAHICTPNWLHSTHARLTAQYSDIVFVEKPGVIDTQAWLQLVSEFPNTRFMMVKNNQWRDNIERMRELMLESDSISIDWLNRDRVPNPGTWFTTKKLAYGGVSRDLMPHLLSLFMALEPEYMTSREIARTIDRRWELSDLTKTDYGKVNENGTYDVDDYLKLNFMCNDRAWGLTANWRTLEEDLRAIKFNLKNGGTEIIELGLCPEEAYQAMIKDAVNSLDDSLFWNNQLLQDCWIHSKVK
jgi:predicted dehydrogenase